MSILAAALLLMSGVGTSAAAPTPEVQNLLVDSFAVSWDPAPGAVSYKVARGLISALPDHCSSGTGLTTQTFIFDGQPPPPGDAFTYLASVLDNAGEGSFGRDSANVERIIVCDTDNDNLRDDLDNCPHDFNPGQTDTNMNGSGDACDFAAFRVGLHARVPLRLFPDGQLAANDIWHYVSPGGQEYAIIGLSNGVAFLRVTNPATPVLVGYVDGAGVSTSWRDMATYGHHAYLVSDVGGVGLQIVDLSMIDAGQVTLVATTGLGLGFTEAHNVFANEASGYLYLAIPDTGGGLGITALDLNTDPVNPTVAGVWVDATPGLKCHDLQVVNYTTGIYAGKEIAFCFGESRGLRIVDVTSKTAMTRLSAYSYPGTRYTHQGWLTEDRRHLLINDEFDESQGVVPTTTTHVVNVENLAAPFLATTFTSGSTATDHNLMVTGSTAYEANYRSGLRVFSVCNLSAVQQIGFFDTYPENDATPTDGAWGVTSQLPSGTILVSDIQRGLFVLDASEAVERFNDPCAMGPALDPLCDTCVDQICAIDPLCCSTAWDASCVAAVMPVCGRTCP